MQEAETDREEGDADTLHVGWVVYGDLDRRSGGYLYDAEVVERLRAAGDEVTVVSLPDVSYLRSLTHNAGRGLRRRLRRVAREVDVLVQDELCHPSLAWANDALPAGTPVVGLVHHLRSAEPAPPWRRRGYRTIERRYLRTLDAVICNSETTRRTVTELAGPEATAESVVAYPAGDRFGEPLPAAEIRRRAHEDPFRVVFLGNVTPRKGLDTLLAGLSRLHCDWDLTVLGSLSADESYAESVARLVGDLGLADRVTLAGRVDDDRLRAELRRGHVLAIPSTYEGFGIAYLEGMCFGLPALASTAGGASELVTHRADGWVVDPGDPSEIADALAPVCRKRDRLARMGLAAADRYRDHPTWAETASTIRAFLTDVSETD
ncbi:glycosyltransferase family 4 protein [Salinirubrum litoreum]|uniref:Glycosyltransferase family 4 protein n=1 Tax=Salinirubrum litoreum TaxID=1126234 RepID=A0ABD5R845_9EURY|nr:glycosyltransferase family 4 protein [Salinirubrum litoreum]